MKISIITVCFNAEKTIEDTIRSVLAQDYPEIEHIIIDGASTDGTMAVIERYRDRIATIVSEPDRGIYDAMNKGIALASGEIVGILNADDFFLHPHVLSTIAGAFSDEEVGAVFADLVYVKPDNLDKTVRRYRSNRFHPGKFAFGWMPAHPTFYLRRDYYERYGLYKTDYKIAADFELLIRMLYRHKVHYVYIPEVLIKMRVGGVSTRSFKSTLVLNREIVRACRENGISTNVFKVYSKYLKKLFELIQR